MKSRWLGHSQSRLRAATVHLDIYRLETSPTTMAAYGCAMGLLLLLVACGGNPLYDYQPFVGYHYPDLTTGAAGGGYYYNPPVAAPSAVATGFFPLHAPAFTLTQVSRSAICTLVNTSMSEVSGEVRLFQGSPHEPVVVSGVVSGLEPGLHGFHVHREGKLGNDCADAGPHFNPDNSTHGGPHDEKRHAGDLGNIEAGPTGVADFAVLSDRLSLVPESKYYAVGRAVVVHQKEDDLGKGGNDESLRTGNAGARLACCVIRPLHF
ncbi:superoxide dismutase [Cu-Zn]-like [Schistocerca serialis cubense]|uniref:superoxide dismutase [Cu-Zn]-like n=1 Tax=Schistocerca serialis cubense TaxID=2023355 RepID=UPI00214E70E7|nr:superoxide dismutase [Cu-Zn]-like [Schistocerca serialis cubense]